LRHGRVADDEQWKNRSNQREFHLHSPFRSISPDARLSGIGQSPVAHEASGPHGLLPSERARLLSLCGRSQFSFSSLNGERFARPVQLNTHLLSRLVFQRDPTARPGTQLRDLKDLRTSPLETKNKFN
jgi:hypothetical protein